ncbi:uncharacterized protein LOC144450059 [Glandiceps talaboti]
MVTSNLLTLTAAFMCLVYFHFVSESLARKFNTGLFSDMIPNSCAAEDGMYQCCNGYYLTNGICTECATGTYGSGCSNSCNGSCQQSVSCSQVDGHYENTCQHQCQCTNHGKCDPANGICLCKTNNWGQYCEKSCDPICKEYEVCEEGICRCPVGKYGQDCSRDCPCSGVTNCDRITGECSCTPSCQEYEVCNPSKGVCDCPDGSFGETCDLTCECFNGAFCDRDTGECICRVPWTGDNCTICNVTLSLPYSTDVSGVFYHCSEKCLNCYNGETCNTSIPGDCQCTVGWTGNRCDQECDGYHHGDNCQHECQCNDFYLCNHVTGDCDRCKPGYRGEQCDIPCQLGKYGYGCISSCDENCGQGECHHVTGNCTTCRAGYHGNDCNLACGTGYFGTNCQTNCNNCTNSERCNHDTGCVCESGWTGELCESPCDAGFYGFNCKNNCTCGIQSQCNHITGDCNYGDEVTGVNSDITTTAAAGGSDNEGNSENQTDSTKYHIPLIVGVVATLIVISVIIACSVYWCKERMSSKRVNTQDDMSTAAEGPEEFEMRENVYVNVEEEQSMENTLDSDADIEHYAYSDLVTDRDRPETVAKSEPKGDMSPDQVPVCTCVREISNKPCDATIPVYTQVNKPKTKLISDSSSNEVDRIKRLNYDYATPEPKQKAGKPINDNYEVSNPVRSSSEKLDAVSSEGACCDPDYNIIDRTGRNYRQPDVSKDGNIYNKMTVVSMDDISCDENNTYNKLDFAPKREEPKPQSDYSTLN